jgi:hypothetical protein
MTGGASAGEFVAIDEKVVSWPVQSSQTMMMALSRAMP